MLVVRLPRVRDLFENRIALPDRYEVRGTLGKGRLGRVFRAHDAEMGCDVAIKTLREVGSDGLFHLKREFRLLAEIAHENIAELYELFHVSPRAFISMEFVDGPDVSKYLSAAFEGENTSARTLRVDGMDRFLDIAAQLVTAVSALHARGRVHRDIKPRNVLVRDNGRVALVDFDLVLPRHEDEGQAHTPGELVGTPEYMAPETLWGATATPASDLYGIGAVLWEALTGRRYSTSPLSEDASTRGSMLTQSVQALPPDISHLIASMLSAQAEQRPSAEASLAQFLRARGTRPVRARVHIPVNASQCVGREQELNELNEAWSRTNGGRAVLCQVSGPSGIGKTTLIREWCSRLSEGGQDPIFLFGRCYPNETITYKGLDDVIDSLSRRLLAASKYQLDEWLPANTDALRAMFPVLAGALEPGSAGASIPPDSTSHRRRQAVECLRELLVNMATSRGLLIWIDDFQWSDKDSVDLLADLLCLGSSPPIMVLLSDRGDAESMRFIEQLAEKTWGAARQVCQVALRPLDGDQIRSILDGMFDGELRLPPSVCEQAVADARGNPFVAKEFARSGMRDDGGEKSKTRASPTAARIEGLSSDEQRLLRVVALAGRPLTRTLAATAAGLANAADPSIVHLRSMQLIRRGSSGPSMSLEIAHDQIRCAVIEQLSEPDLCRIHLALAQASRASNTPDPAFLLHHLRAAGEPASAREYVLEAANAAFEAMAFGQAADLFGLALELGMETSPPWSLHAQRADALARCGRCIESAQAYGDAVEVLNQASPPHDDLQHLLRCRAEQYLRSGNANEGMRALEDCLGSVNLHFPSSDAAALFRILRARFGIYRLGSGLRERTEAKRPAQLCRAADACWSAGLGLNMTDLLRSFVFQTEHVHYALASGEPKRVLSALASEVVYRACEGGRKNRGRAEALSQRANALAEQVSDVDSKAMLTLSLGVAEYFRGHFRPALALLGEAYEVFRERQEGITWEILNCRMYRAWSLAWIGELDELHRQLQGDVQEARQLNNVLAETALCNAHSNLGWLAYDGPSVARQRATESLERFRGTGFQSPHYMNTIAMVRVDLAEGKGWQAWSRIEAAWPQLRRLMFLRLEFFSTELGYLRGCAAIGAMQERPKARDLQNAVQSQVRALQRRDTALARALSGVLQLGLQAHRGEVDPTLRSRVRELVHAAGLGAHAAALEWCEHRSDRWFRERRIVEPASFCRAILPVFLVK